jgi:hypothetical protein
MFRPIASAFLILLLLGPVACNRQAKEPAFVPGLGEIMTLTQMRHSKLWFAGQNANWPLAAYEIDELKEGLEDAATFHPTHKDAELPIPKLIETIIMPSVDQLEKAVEAKDSDRFKKAFDELTDGCNRCHQATKFGFNVVVRPESNPYSNQSFQPPR